MPTAACGLVTELLGDALCVERHFALWMRCLLACINPADSHFELLQAFASDALLERVSEAFDQHGYRHHELVIPC